MRTYLLSAVALWWLVGASAVAAGPQAAKSAVLSFGADKLIVDVHQAPWEYVVGQRKGPQAYGFVQASKRDAELARSEYAAVSQTTGWKPIRVGRRWEPLGHPELNNQIVWLRLKLQIPAELKGYRVGFFCTAVDDAADFFLNGKHLARHSYVWGARIPGPVNVDLTPELRFGGENLLVVRVNDFSQARGGGILGHVLLYRTLPYQRTGRGGLALSGDAAGPFSVVLHLGDGLLCRGQQTAFTGQELRALEIPPYILREEELILVAPQSAVPAGSSPHRVQFDQVCPTRDARALAVQCQALPARLGQFELLTIPVELAATYDNPFDPRQINVQALVETPSGKTEQVAAFFRQDFTSVAAGAAGEEEILLPKAGNPWRIYYRPREVGVHKLHVIAQDKSGVRRTPNQTITVDKSARRGFLRVSKEDPRFLEFDNGESYYGIGPSGWYRDANYIFGGNTRHVSTRKLDEYYRRKARAGCNYDYCLAEFFGRLYIEGGHIDQHVAWKCEHRLRTLEEIGIHWVTCYDDLCRSTVYGLDTLPYSVAQGGPCASIEELYVNERALEMQRDHLRYFVSRMSDSPALLVWAIGDEGQAGSRFSPLMVRAWIKGLQNYVRQIDIYQHPHAMCEGPRSLVEGGDVIIIPDWYFHRDIDAVALSLEIMEKYGQFNCPLINPEGGMVEWTKPADRLGPKQSLYYLTGERWTFPEAISFHNHLWISLFLKGAVGGTEWMGAFIDRKNELYHATAIAKYLEGESLTKPHWQIQTPEVSDQNLRAFALQSQAKTLVWVQNRAYTWIEAGHQGQTPQTVSGARAGVPVAKDAIYQVEVWDTRRGTVVSKSTIRSSGKRVTCPLPPIEKDVALKVILGAAD